MQSMFGPEAKKQLKESAGSGALGIEMGLAVVLGYFAGHWLDARLETTPYLTYFGLLLGLAAGFKGVYRVARNYTKNLKGEAATDA